MGVHFSRVVVSLSGLWSLPGQDFGRVHYVANPLLVVSMSGCTHPDLRGKPLLVVSTAKAVANPLQGATTRHNFGAQYPS